MVEGQYEILRRQFFERGDNVQLFLPQIIIEGIFINFFDQSCDFFTLILFLLKF